MARMKRADRIAWLEKQMEIQENALATCKGINEINIHSYLLYLLTKEWGELLEKEGK